ncbi:TraR/DksA family transcriptional regulator [Streptomyces sp. NPDC057554]|uniref:TraR/DksA family transcriptional regulator n=1 Tax=unclassified Streptomyces TaxID=2593676 RepID=UPI0036C6F457
MVAKKTAEETAAGQKADGKPPADVTSPDGADTEQAPGKAPSKKTAAKKAAAKKTAAKKAPAKKAAAKKTAAKKSTASAKKSPAKKSAAKKASKTAAQTATGAAQAAEETGAHTVVAKKSASPAAGPDEAAAVPPARGAVAAAAPGELAVRPGEDPWTPEEVTEARTLLTGEITRLRDELETSGAALAGLMRDSGDGAGDDEADTGTKNITREHELALAANAQEMLEQTERALARLEAGTYGLCEICGKPIGKARMQAFPRATLCVEDKQKQERRG